MILYHYLLFTPTCTAGQERRNRSIYGPGEEEGNEKRGNPQGINHHIKGDNNTVSIFIDTGSGDDFISEQFASTLINLKGYKPILNNESCLVCTAYGKDCTPC